VSASDDADACVRHNNPAGELPETIPCDPRIGWKKGAENFAIGLTPSWAAAHGVNSGPIGANVLGVHRSEASALRGDTEPFCCALCCIDWGPPQDSSIRYQTLEGSRKTRENCLLDPNNGGSHSKSVQYYYRVSNDDTRNCTYCIRRHAAKIYLRSAVVVICHLSILRSQMQYW